MPKIFRVPLSMLILLFVAACQKEPACPAVTGTPKYLSPLDLETLTSPSTQNSSTPVEVEISGKQMKVDKVVTGPLCNDYWKGSVYVACNVQVLKWEEKPLFLENCNLEIEPDTVVYVAYHNDSAYYNGCSCHTGEQP
jgi:hypothetical protein